MNFIIYFSLLVLAIGCSSNPKSYVEGIKNENFNSPTLVKYNYRDDFLANSNSRYFPLLADETLQRHKKSEIKDVLDKANELTKITVLCHLKEYEDAYEVVDNLFSRYKEHPVYWNSVGICYFLEGNLRKAQLFFNKSLDVEKNYAPALNNLGVIYRARGEDQKALVAFERARSASKYSKTPKFNIAQLYLEYGIIDKAFKFFFGMKKEYPSDIDVAAALATTYLFKGNYRSAVSEFSKLPSDFQERDDIGINYAYALYLKGDKKEARSVLSDVELKNPKLNAYYNKVKQLVRK
mgnify:CR=1 FL=1